MCCNQIKESLINQYAENAYNPDRHITYPENINENEFQKVELLHWKIEDKKLILNIRGTTANWHNQINNIKCSKLLLIFFPILVLLLIEIYILTTMSFSRLDAFFIGTLFMVLKVFAGYVVSLFGREVNSFYETAANHFLNNLKMKTNNLKDVEGIHIAGHSKGGGIALVLKKILEQEFKKIPINAFLFNPAPCFYYSSGFQFENEVNARVFFNENDPLKLSYGTIFVKYVAYHKRSFFQSLLIAVLILVLWLFGVSLSYILAFFWPIYLLFSTLALILDSHHRLESIQC